MSYMKKEIYEIYNISKIIGKTPGTTCGAGTVYPSEEPDYISSFSGVHNQ